MDLIAHRHGPIRQHPRQLLWPLGQVHSFIQVIKKQYVES